MLQSEGLQTLRPSATSYAWLTFIQLTGLKYSRQTLVKSKGSRSKVQSGAVVFALSLLGSPSWSNPEGSLETRGHSKMRSTLHFFRFLFAHESPVRS